jgi:hypothetical protein
MILYNITGHGPANIFHLLKSWSTLLPGTHFFNNNTFWYIHILNYSVTSMKNEKKIVE